MALIVNSSIPAPQVFEFLKDDTRPKTLEFEVKAVLRGKSIKALHPFSARREPITIGRPRHYHFLRGLAPALLTINVLTNPPATDQFISVIAPDDRPNI